MSNYDNLKKTPAAGHIETQSPTTRFKDSSPVSGGEVMGVLLVTVLMLAAFAALATLAKRKGWIERVFKKTALLNPAASGLRLVGMMKVSRNTTVFKVSDGKSEFVIVESSLNAMLQPLNQTPCEETLP